MRAVLVLALAAAGCTSSAQEGRPLRLDREDGVACRFAEVPPDPRASKRSPQLLGGLELLRDSLAGPPGTERRRGAIVADVLIGHRLTVEGVWIGTNMSAVSDADVREVLMRTRWSPSDSRYPEGRKRCRIQLRLDRTDDGVRRDPVTA